jgi:23S rRNA (cytosine1962-C5)-methyltransferase
VHDSNDRFLGSAIYNPHSRIRARIFAVSRQLFGDSYITEAIERAVALRKTMGFLPGSCRLIFGDSDGLPGLVADKIGDYLVIQPLTYAVDRRINRIVDILNEQVGPQGIVVRNDAPIRAKEGLEVGDIVTHGEIPERIEATEAGLHLFADIAGGQKTGMFLDQRLNRKTLKPFAQGARVLDLFCHVGGWALRAAKYGAVDVTGVDSSQQAIDMATAGATANGMEQVRFVKDDVFDYLRREDQEQSELYDIIVCDPPAFAKTKSHFEDAFRA